MAHRQNPDGTRFLLIRHAESEHNAARRWQGLTDSPLSEVGVAQARALARQLAGEPIEGLVASPLARAARTAAIVGEPHGLAPEVETDLRELDVGAWGGLTRAEIELRWPQALARFESGDPDARPVGGESRRELARRVGRASAGIAARHAGKRIAVVTHLGVIATLLPGVRLANAEFRGVAVAEVDLARLAR